MTKQAKWGRINAGCALPHLECPKISNSCFKMYHSCQLPAHLKSYQPSHHPLGIVQRAPQCTDLAFPGFTTGMICSRHSAIFHYMSCLFEEVIYSQISSAKCVLDQWVILCPVLLYWCLTRPVIMETTAAGQNISAVVLMNRFPDGKQLLFASVQLPSSLPAEY